MGDIGDNPRKVEVIPATPAVRPAPSEPSTPVVVPEPVPV